MRALRIVVLTLVIAGAALLAYAWSGTYDVGADAPHSRAVHRLLDMARDRSVDARAASITVPPLDDAEQLRHGAGNYAAMCVECHLRPGEDSSEMHRGLYPRPPALASHERHEPAADFWVIKHGIKASGMPAWGKSMDDASIWGLVAFIQKLPTMSPEAYHEAVETSGGHHHGGPGEDEAGEDEHSHDGAAPTQDVPGKAAPTDAAPPAAEHDDGHDHEHSHDS